MLDWIDEIDLSTNGDPISMGVRKLGERPWLLVDNDRDDDLALKAKLSSDPSSTVFLALEGTEKVGETVLSWIRDEGIPIIDSKLGHPLERAGLSVQEDLCLIHRTKQGWVLKAASLCFPSLWKLEDKVGQNMMGVHTPVDGYSQYLEKKVDIFFNRFGNEPVWRRNWFIHSDNSLHQPSRLEEEPLVESSKVYDDLYVRSERQTLRALGDAAWILFTIRVQRAPLRYLIQQRHGDFLNWLCDAPPSHHRHKALQSAQIAEIISAIQ